MIEHLMWLVMILALIGTIANIYKLRWCFVVWFASNVLWTTYNLWHEHWAQAAQFAVYTGLTAWGWWQWRPIIALPAPIEPETELSKCRGCGVVLGHDIPGGNHLLCGECFIGGKPAPAEPEKDRPDYGSHVCIDGKTRP